MDFDLTDEQKMLKESARKLMKREVEPYLALELLGLSAFVGVIWGKHYKKRKRWIDYNERMEVFYGRSIKKIQNY